TLFKPGLNRSAAIEKSIQTAQATIPGVFLARDLINEPPSVTTARFLGTQAQRHCRGRGLSVEVWGKKKIEAMNLAGLLAVNRGSHEEPRFIKIHYQPSGKARKKVALIGKGITFDSGGLSLKPAKSMETMKLDMAGVAGIFSNHQALADNLMRCARDTGEKLWQLPLVKEYREALKSSVADMKNVAGPYGGAITAALILQEFVDDIPWAHLDIAGPAFAETDTAICAKGGTGFGVRTLVRFLLTL